MMRRTAMLGGALALTACSGANPEKLALVKPGMTAPQVEKLLGRPSSIEQSETIDQTLSGEVDHYPGSRGEGRVVLVNHTVFKAEFVPGAKS